MKLTMVACLAACGIACSHDSTSATDHPARIAFLSAPITMFAGAPPGGVPVVVQELDAEGNVIETANDPVTIGLASNAFGDTLAGVTNVLPVKGVAVFDDVTVAHAGAGLRIVASAGAGGALRDTSHAVSVLEFRQVAAGGGHSCGLASDSSAYCWGNLYEVGAVLSTDNRLPVRVRAPATVVTVSASLDYSCVLTADHHVWCWGGNDYGQLGDGTHVDRRLPVQVGGALAFGFLKVGPGHACAITTTHETYCWGTNSAGEIGDSTVTPAAVPTLVHGGLHFTVVSPGYGFTCALDAAGSAYCWGANSDGELGDSTTAGERHLPAPVAGGHHFTAIGTGDEHACAIDDAGVAWCWGQDTHGQLGDGGASERNYPVPVSGGLTFTSIAAGTQHTCATTATNVGYCWGNNSSSQLGLGKGAPLLSNVPVTVNGDIAFAQMAPGDSHSCGMSATHVVWCWGDNGFHQLGDPFVARSQVPNRVRSP